MNRFTLSCAASAAFLLAGVGSAQAATRIYGFNDANIDGFGLIFSDSDTTTVTQSLTTGKTEGASALHIQVGASSGFTQTSVFTSTVPSAVIDPAATTDTLDVTTNYGNSNFLFITQVFFLEGTRPNGSGGNLAVDKKLIPFSTTENNALSPSGTATPATLTYTLKNYKDPFGSTNGFGTTNLFTPGEILAHNQAFFAGSNLSIPTYGLEVFNGASTGVDFYIDNISVPSVPEPASLGLLAAGGLMLARRRAR